jgi:hypothetical protein
MRDDASRALHSRERLKRNDAQKGDYFIIYTSTGYKLDLSRMTSIDKNPDDRVRKVLCNLNAYVQEIIFDSVVQVFRLLFHCASNASSF